MLLPRFLTALIGIPLVFFSTWIGYLPFFFLVLGIVFLSLWEFYVLCLNKGYNPYRWIGLVCGMVLYFSLYLNQLKLAVPVANEGTAAIFTILIILLLTGAMVTAQVKEDYINLILTIWGIIYIVWLLGHLVLIRQLRPYGREYIFMLLSVIWISDTVAFLVGRKYGKHRLLPKISAMKTWEGSIGGLITAVVVVLIFREFILLDRQRLPVLDYFQAILLGLLLGIFSQLGDLCESFFKRFIGVKDTSPLLPGHGGMLDRFDSITFAAPVLYYFIRSIS